MGRPKKNKPVVLPDEQDETQTKGVPGLFQPGEWDVAEEMSNNEALLDYRKENQDQY